jgi:hypothetical protein
MIAIAGAVCALTIFVTTTYAVLFPQEGRR